MPLTQEYFAVRMRALAWTQACTLLLALSLATRSATSFMRLSQTTLRTCTAWLLAVLVFAWLHPAFAAMAVLAQGPQSMLVEVCTHQGVRWVSVDSTESAQAADTDEDGNAASSHCPLCRVLGDLPLDLGRDDLRFAPPAWLRQPPPDSHHPTQALRWVVRISPARAPPGAYFFV